MVQGATGVDVALLAVSAVEGVMPQTREHVRVLELLGVTRMVVALTMRDLADDETAELAELDLMDFLGDTVFANAPVVPVSSRTGAGIEDVRLALDTAIDSFLADAASRPVRPCLAPRLPIDRCFTIKGSGTVVTGTLHDAPVAVGDELVSSPAGVRCRVRAIQVHGDTPRALPGQRVALNIVGDGAGDLPRGEVLCGSGAEGSTLRLIARFTYLGREGAKPVPFESGTRVHVMVGTAEVLGRIMLMEGAGPIAPGETRTVQIRLKERLPVRSGDGLIVLAFSPVVLIGGGCVLLSRCRRSRDLSAEEVSLLRALDAGDRAAAIAAWLGLQRLPVPAAVAARALDLSGVEVARLLHAAVASGDAVALHPERSTEELYAAPAVLDAALAALADTLVAMHKAAPKQTGFTPGEVAHVAWPKAGEDVASALILEGCARGICAQEGSEVYDPHSAAAAIRVVREAGRRIAALLDEAGLDAPTLPEVGQQLQLDRDTMTRALRELSLNRSIVKVERDVALSAAAEAQAREVVAAAIEAAGGAVTTSVLREALGVSRKRAISILEHLDAVRFTTLDKGAGGLRSLR